MHPKKESLGERQDELCLTIDESLHSAAFESLQSCDPTSYVESGLSTSSKGQGKAKEKDHKGAPKVIGDRPLQSGEERDPFSLPSIYMARFTNIIESQGSILLLAQSLDLSIVQALKAPSGHGHNYYIRQGLEAYYQRLSTRIGLGLVSSDPPILSRPP
ncbi:hypothetical protein V6N13_009229 [Hibiscus sabdariffa]